MSRQPKTTKAVASADTHRGGGRSFERIAWQFGPPHLANLTVPAAGLLAHAAWGGQPVSTPLATLGMAGGTIVLSLLAHKIGRVREQIVRWHTTTTVALAGTGVTLTTILGFPGAHKSTLLQVMLGIGALTAFSWNLRKLESLRQGDGAPAVEQDKWGQILNLAGTRPGTPKQIGARIEVPLHHSGGDTVKNAQGALAAIEAAAGVVPGRSRVVPDPDDASRSTLVLITEDVLKKTIPWPGPSIPGGSIIEPVTAGLYEDDQPFQFALPGVPNHAPSNMGYMGMTRAGKTQSGLVNTVDMMTRRDVVFMWADLTKGEQTAGPLREGLDLYCDTPASAKAFTKMLKEIAKARANALGKAGFRQWEPACFTHPDLQMPYIVAHFEEADELMTADPAAFIWLTGKVLSCGIAIVVSLQRADHGSMPTTARSNIASWLCFGVGDSYSAQFALSQATIEAGADPEQWKARRQGYFYGEANSIGQERFPVPARSYYATDAQLAAVVAEWAPQMAQLDAISVKAGGDTYRSLKAKTAGEEPATQPRKVETIVVSDKQTDEDLDELLEEVRADLPEQPEDELITGRTDPGTAIPAWTGPDMQFGSKPEAVSQQQAEAAFDELLRQMVDEGVETFQVDDLVKRYPFRQRPWASKRLSRMCNGELTLPPGIALERAEEAGRYRFEHLGELAMASS